MIYRMKLILIFLLLCGSACAWPWSPKTSAPKAESIVEREYEDGKVTKETIRRSAKGASSSGLPDFKTGAIDFAEGSLSVGGVSVHYELPRGADRMLLWAGVGLMVLGVLVFGWFCKSFVLAGLSFLLGVCIIGLAYYPWVAGVTAGISLLVGAGYTIYALRRRHLSENTAMVLRSAISEVPDTVEEEVMKKVNTKAIRHNSDIESELRRLDKKRITN